MFCSYLFAPVTADTFNSSNLINDVVFDNTNTMNATSIDAFLNKFSGSCISSNNGFLAPDLTGYNPTAGFTYGSNVTAGKVIDHAALAYGVNPEVLVSMLQEQEGVVDGSGPYGCGALSLSAAMGYGCPDGGTTHNYSNVDIATIKGTEITSVTGTCVSNVLQVGFSEQVIHAAWLLKFGEQRSQGNMSFDVQLSTTTDNSGDSWVSTWNNSDDPIACYGGPMTQGTYQVCPNGAQVYYDGYTTIDSTSIYMTNGATASLYWYTPHINGNLGWWNIFEQWFGSTYTSNIAYEWNVAGQYAYSDSAYTQPFTNGIYVQPGQTAYLEVSARNFGYENWSQSVVHLGTSQPDDRCSIFADSSWLSCSRTQMQESSVLPGNSATYKFSITAPSIPGEYREYFNLVADGTIWFNDPGLYFDINVVPPQQATNTNNTGLTSNESIAPGQYLLSPDTQSTLNLLPNGELALYENYKKVWSNNVSDSTVTKLIMQSDGNLVEYNSSGTAVWNTGTYGNSGDYLSLLPDGNLVIYSSTNTMLWSSGTAFNPTHLDTVSKDLPYGIMYPGQSIESDNLEFRLVLQSDGNLVEYDSSNQPIWNTGTYGNSGDKLILQSDGNLVLYSIKYSVLWASNTSGSGADKLSIKDSGALYMNSSTNSHILWNSEAIYPGQSLGTDYLGDYRLTLQLDGNLVLYNSKGNALWNTGTYGSNPSVLILQSNGDLVLYGFNGKVLWSSNSYSTVSTTHLVMQSDGNLVVYTQNNVPIWSTNTGQ